MLLTDASGILISAFTTSAQDAEVHMIETLVDIRVTKKRIPCLFYNRAADADWLRDALVQQGIELLTPHREGRKKPSRQNGRKLRRYRCRWKVGRTISCLQYDRRLFARQERDTHSLKDSCTGPASKYAHGSLEMNAFLWPRQINSSSLLLTEPLAGRHGAVGMEMWRTQSDVRLR